MVFDEISIQRKTNALVRGSFYSQDRKANFSQNNVKVVTSNVIEKMLADSIKHRFQASGEIVVNLTSSWESISIETNSILKLSDVSPDELSSSSFVRFSLWDSGAKVGDFSCPARSIQVGSKLLKEDFKLQKVDVLKQHANSVPSSTNISSFQLDTYLAANTPLKWNNLSKANLIKKGQVIDVFASGKGIYVTMKGLALENGSLDSFVKVRNLSSDKEFHAKVLSENSVKVSL
jgi:flagella basal body P-ring formation protein FlgA